MKNNKSRNRIVTAANNINESNEARLKRLIENNKSRKNHKTVRVGVGTGNGAKAVKTYRVIRRKLRGFSGGNVK